MKTIILVVYDDDSVDSAKQLEYKVHETHSGPGKKHNNPYAGAQITERVKVAMKWLADPKTQETIKTYAGLAMKTLVKRGLLKF